MEVVAVVLLSLIMVSFFSLFILTALFNIGYLKTLRRLEAIHSDWWLKLRNPFEGAFGKQYRKVMFLFLLQAPLFNDVEVRAFGVRVLRFIKPYLINTVVAFGFALLSVFAALAVGVAQTVRSLCAESVTDEKWLTVLYCLFAIVWIGMVVSFIRRMCRISRAFNAVSRARIKNQDSTQS